MSRGGTAGPPLPATSPRLAEAAGGFAVGLLLSAIGASVAAAATGYRPGSGPTPVAVTVGGVLGLWAGLVGAVVFSARRRGAPDLRRFVGLRLSLPWDLVVGAGVGAACQYLLVPLIYLPAEQFDPSLAHQFSQPAQQDTAAAHTLGPAVVLVVVLALGAPIVEELFFRGLLLRALRARTGPAVSVVASGVLFALAHFEAVQFAGLAAFGVVLGVMALRSGRLGPSIAAHVTFNAVAVASLIHLR